MRKSSRRKRLTVADIHDVVETFLELAEAGRDEEARELEYELHRRVLRALAENFFTGSAVDLARAAAITMRIKIE